MRSALLRSLNPLNLVVVWVLYFFFFFTQPFCENCVIYESPAIRTYFYISNIPAGGILALLSGRKTALFLDPF